MTLTTRLSLLCALALAPIPTLHAQRPASPPATDTVRVSIDEALARAGTVRDRNFNRAGLNVGPGLLPRERRCAGGGAPATAPVCLAGRSAWGPGG